MLRFYQLKHLFGTIKQFKLPDLGEKIKEAVVKEWHVKVGDKVEEFQPVADVATDKMFTQIPSSYNGKVHKIFHEVEQTCQVGELFLEIEVEDDKQVSKEEKKAEEKMYQPPPQSDSPIAHPAPTTMDATAEPQSDTNQNSSLTLASPAVRRIAKERGVDLSKVQGSGRDGRVLAEDIDKHLSKTTQQKETQQPKITSFPKVLIEGVTEQKMSDFQKGMYKTMTESNTIPHLYLKEEVDLTALSELREKLKKQTDTPITFMSLFIKAFSLALLKYPIINSTYDPSKPFEYKQHHSHNISLALDSPKGLVVPNIKNCQNLSILDIHQELNKLKNLGEKGQLSRNELSDGTVCISNIGTIGGTYTGPLILPPQVCIVGLGRVQVLPRYNQKMEIVPSKIMNVSFGCDHRVLDGATVTRFSNQWKSYLENPFQMLVYLK